eukprot:gene11503-biopygen8436
MGNVRKRKETAKAEKRRSGNHFAENIIGNQRLCRGWRGWRHGRGGDKGWVLRYERGAAWHARANSIHAPQPTAMRASMRACAITRHRPALSGG